MASLQVGSFTPQTNVETSVSHKPSTGDGGETTGLELVVDPEWGNDANDGFSPASALRTLASARDRVRRILREEQPRSIVVHLLPGRHRVYNDFDIILDHFDCFELDLRGHTQV